VPLVALGAGLVALLGHAICANRGSVRALQFVSIVLILSGCLGTWLHYNGRAEFRLELDPSLAGWNLFRAAMTGSTTPPVLAPAMMIQLGVLGLASLYRHPAMERSSVEVRVD
jgi:hypothetical protein